jgi:DUF438 domain-containing protein
MPTTTPLHATKDNLIQFAQRLNAGEPPEALKPLFRQLLRQTSLLEIAHLAGELLKEKHSPTGLLRLYGLQVEILRERFAH